MGGRARTTRHHGTDPFGRTVARVEMIEKGRLSWLVLEAVRVDDSDAVCHGHLSSLRLGFFVRTQGSRSKGGFALLASPAIAVSSLALRNRPKGSMDHQPLPTYRRTQGWPVVPAFKSGGSTSRHSFPRRRGSTREPPGCLRFGRSLPHRLCAPVRLGLGSPKVLPLGYPERTAT